MCPSFFVILSYLCATRAHRYDKMTLFCHTYVPFFVILSYLCALFCDFVMSMCPSGPSDSMLLMVGDKEWNNI